MDRGGLLRNNRSEDASTITMTVEDDLPFLLLIRRLHHHHRDGKVEDTLGRMAEVRRGVISATTATTTEGREEDRVHHPLHHLVVVIAWNSGEDTVEIRSPPVAAIPCPAVKGEEVRSSPERRNPMIEVDLLWVEDDLGSEDAGTMTTMVVDAIVVARKEGMTTMTLGVIGVASSLEVPRTPAMEQ